MRKRTSRQVPLLLGVAISASEREDGIGAHFFAGAVQITRRHAQDPVAMSRIKPLASGGNGAVGVDYDIFPAVGAQGVVEAENTFRIQAGKAGYVVPGERDLLPAVAYDGRNFAGRAVRPFKRGSFLSHRHGDGERSSRPGQWYFRCLLCVEIELSSHQCLLVSGGAHREQENFALGNRKREVAVSGRRGHLFFKRHDPGSGNRHFSFRINDCPGKEEFRCAVNSASRRRKQSFSAAVEKDEEKYDHN
ncbi:MAG: hypothetical protein V2A78_01125 [bacterium]